MNLDEAEKRIKELEEDVKQLRARLGNPPKQRIDAIGKPFPVKGEPFIPTVES